MKSNTKSLLSHAFSTMKKLDEGQIDNETAKAQANLMKQANNVLKYELDRAIAREKWTDIKIREIEE